MRADSVEIYKGDIVLKLTNGNTLTIPQEVANDISYILKDEKIKEFVNVELKGDDFTEYEKSRIRDAFISRSEAFVEALKHQILEAAVSEFCLDEYESEDA